MATGLSEPGYNHASIVMGEEYIVDHHSHFPDRTYGDLPGTRVRDPGNYCVAIYGTPGDENGWGWRIGGHHLSLTYTLKGDSVSPTPAFFGAEPSRVKMAGGVEMRPLAAEEDLARTIVTGLDADSRARAILSPIPPTDITQMNRPRIEDGALYQIGGNGPGRARPARQAGPDAGARRAPALLDDPRGLPAREMDAAQRETLARLVRVYFEHLAEPIGAQFASLLDPERLDGTTFSWAGPTEYASPHYYRIQGERLLIEYDCTQDDANHTHTVWRDPRATSAKTSSPGTTQRSTQAKTRLARPAALLALAALTAFACLERRRPTPRPKRRPATKPSRSRRSSPRSSKAGSPAAPSSSPRTARNSTRAPSASPTSTRRSR